MQEKAANYLMLLRMIREIKLSSDFRNLTSLLHYTVEYFSQQIILKRHAVRLFKLNRHAV